MSEESNNCETGEDDKDSKSMDADSMDYQQPEAEIKD
jgi:hypothetical protein